MLKLKINQLIITAIIATSAVFSCNSIDKLPKPTGLTEEQLRIYNLSLETQRARLAEEARKAAMLEGSTTSVLKSTAKSHELLSRSTYSEATELDPAAAARRRRNAAK